MDYRSPEQLAKFDAQHFAKGVELYDSMKASHTAYLESKERTAELKKLWEADRLKHEEHTAEGKKWRGHKPPGVQQDLPFERKADPAVDGAHEPTGYAKGPGEVPADTVKASAFKPDAPNSDLWRQFPVSRWTIFGLAPGDVKKLSEGKIKGTSKAHPIITVGDLSDFTQPWANDPTRNYNFTDLAGLGEAGATRIGDAQIRFWNEWNTKGLAAEFAREMGVPLNADAKADAGTGKGTPGDAGGDGDKPSKPASAGKGGKPSKEAAKKPAKSPKPKHHKRLPRVGGQSTPKINPSGVDPAAPFADGADEHPATVPFEDGRQAAGKEPKSDAGGEEPSAAAGA